MSKIVILSCTNRPNSNTLRVSTAYAALLDEAGVENVLFDLCDLPREIAFSETFGNRSADLAALVSKYITANRKFIFVIPEYNGSFPGILKLFLDCTHPREWSDKDACLVGVSDGRAGNLRGLEHLTGILSYLKMHVYHNKLPISVINRVMDARGVFADEQLKACRDQVKGFINF